MVRRTGLAGCLGALALALALGVAGCSDAASQEECEALLDKLVELEITAGGADKLTGELRAEVEDQRKQLREYVSERFMEQCRKSTPGSVVRCGVKATSPAEFAACEKP